MTRSDGHHGISSPIHALLGDPDLTYWDGRYWLYATNDGTPGWVTSTVNAFSSTDLVGWTDHGVAYDSLVTVSWHRQPRRTWAPAVLHAGPGRHVLFTAEDGHIACAVSERPQGPFIDIGHPIVAADTLPGYQIDPSVFVDVDGMAYLLWGNGVAYMAPLTADGTGIDRDDIASWIPENFVEAIEIRHRRGTYHATWSVGDTRRPDYHVDYATAPGPHGPWTYQGILLEPDEDAGVLGTGHHSILNLPGSDDWIIAYHRWATVHGSGWRREVMFAPVDFDPAGRMRAIRPTTVWYRHPLGEKGDQQIAQPLTPQFDTPGP